MYRPVRLDAAWITSEVQLTEGALRVQIVAHEPLGSTLARVLGGHPYIGHVEDSREPLLIYAHSRIENWRPSQHGGLRFLERILTNSREGVRVLVIGFLRGDCYGELSYLLTVHNYVRLPVSELPLPQRFPWVSEEICSIAVKRQSRSETSRDAGWVLHEFSSLRLTTVRKNGILRKLVTIKRGVRSPAVGALLEQLTADLVQAHAGMVTEILERYRREFRRLWGDV